MGYKAFEPGMICRGKQYAENTVFEETGADGCCQAGVMHYCEEPLDCLDFYPLVNDNGEITEFAEVEPLAEVLKKDNNRATKKLRIGAKLSLKDFINAQVDIQMEKGNNETAASGYRSQLAASGYRSQLAASGDGSQLAASGYRSQLAASGDWSQLAASGYGSKLAASGDGSKLAASGYGSKLAASGYGSKLAASGYESQLAASGANSVAAAIGKDSMVSASLGSWIVLAEYDEQGKPLCVRAAQIDGEKLRPNVFYKLKDGEFVEAK